MRESTSISVKPLSLSASTASTPNPLATAPAMSKSERTPGRCRRPPRGARPRPPPDCESCPRVQLRQAAQHARIITAFYRAVEWCFTGSYTPIRAHRRLVVLAGAHPHADVGTSLERPTSIESAGGGALGSAPAASSYLAIAELALSAARLDVPVGLGRRPATQYRVRSGAAAGGARLRGLKEFPRLRGTPLRLVGLCKVRQILAGRRIVQPQSALGQPQLHTQHSAPQHHERVGRATTG